MEKQVQEHSSLEEQHPVDYDSDKSPNFHSMIPDNLERDHESQTSEKERSTFRLVLLLVALWVCPKPPAPFFPLQERSWRNSSLESYFQH